MVELSTPHFETHTSMLRAALGVGSQYQCCSRFKKELKKRKASADQYSSLGKRSQMLAFMTSLHCLLGSTLALWKSDHPMQSADDGLKYFDQALGSGAVAEKGKKVKVGCAGYCACLPFQHDQIPRLTSVSVQVHFDCMYKGIDVVSSRQARLLGGNRTISEVRAKPAGHKQIQAVTSECPLNLTWLVCFDLSSHVASHWCSH